MFLPKNIIYLRNKVLKTQPEIAKILNVTQSTYSSYENGRTQPNIENIILLSNYFDVSIDELLTRDLRNEGKKIGASIQQTNNGGIGNTNNIIHSESDWEQMSQRIKYLELTIEAQKQTIAAKDELIAALKNKQ